MARMPTISDLEAAVDAAVNLAQAQAKAIAALPGAINAVAEAANNINAAATEARAVIRKAQAVTDRLDAMLDHVEPTMSEITPTLLALKEAQQRIVAMTGSTEKMASFVEDAGAGLSKLAGLSGATNLFNRLASAASGDPGRGLPAARTAPVGALTAAAEILDAEVHDADVHDGDVHDAEIHDAEIHDAGLVEGDTVSPAMAALMGWRNVDDTSPEPGLADAELADAELADRELREQATADAREAEVDAALEPVELGSEADGPDLEENSEPDEQGHATG